MEILLRIDNCKEKMNLDEFTLTESDKKDIIKGLDIESHVKSVEYANTGAGADRMVIIVRI